MHAVFGKLYLVLVLSLWFVANKKWWRFCLAPAFILGVYQFLSIFVSHRFKDELPLQIVLGIIIGVIFLTILNVINIRLSSLLFSDTKLLSSDLFKLIKALNSQKKVFNIKNKAIDSTDEPKLKNLQRSLKDLETNRQFQKELKYNQQAEGQPSKIKEIVIAIILLALPALFYSYRLVPDDLTDLKLFGFTYDHGFPNLQYFIYYLSVKLYTLFFFIIWYMTCKNYWRYGILINIIIMLLQIMTLLSPNFGTIMDEYELYYSMPIVLPILLIMLLIYKVYTYQKNISIIDDKLDFEINEMISGMKQEDIANSSGEFLRNLMDNKHSMSEEEYVSQLSVLKNRLSQELQHLNNTK